MLLYWMKRKERNKTYKKEIIENYIELESDNWTKLWGTNNPLAKNTLTVNPFKASMNHFNGQIG